MLHYQDRILDVSQIISKLMLKNGNEDIILNHYLLQSLDNLSELGKLMQQNKMDVIIVPEEVLLFDVKLHTNIISSLAKVNISIFGSETLTNIESELHTYERVNHIANDHIDSFYRNYMQTDLSIENQFPNEELVDFSLNINLM